MSTSPQPYRLQGLLAMEDGLLGRKKGRTVNKANLWQLAISGFSLFPLPKYSSFISKKKE